jgi:hypothetical protein
VGINAIYARQLLGCVAGLAIMFALGLDKLLPQRIRKPALLSGGAFLAAVTPLILSGYYLAAFRPLPLPDTITRAKWSKLSCTGGH